MRTQDKILKSLGVAVVNSALTSSVMTPLIILRGMPVLFDDLLETIPIPSKSDILNCFVGDGVATIRHKFIQDAKSAFNGNIKGIEGSVKTALTDIFISNIFLIPVTLGLDKTNQYLMYGMIGYSYSFNNVVEYGLIFAEFLYFCNNSFESIVTVSYIVESIAVKYIWEEAHNTELEQKDDG